MIKYGVIWTKGNESVILETCDSREFALAARERQRVLHSAEDCQIDAIKGEFDENDQLLYNRYRIYYW